MKYIDHLKTANPINLFGWNDLRKRISAAEKLIGLQQDSVDLVFENIQECKQQITKWQELMEQDIEANFDVEIENFAIIRQYYELNGRYLLLNMDILVAFKYMLKAKNDWDYRFFARRSYTLMHETRVGYVGKLGGFKNVIKDKVPENIYETYCSCIKDFNTFFQEHDQDFVNVRNLNEAHKGEDFEKQYDSICNLSVEKSSILIHGFQVYMANLYMVLNVILTNLNNYTSTKLLDNMRAKMNSSK